MGTTYQDYYKILGVDRKASASEIKAAYRKMARKHHPDLHAKGEKAAAEAKFKEINEAYTVLSDTEKRARYDQLGDNWRNGQEWQPPPDMRRPGAQAGSETDFGDFEGFSDFFESLFGRAGAGGFTDGFRPARSMRGQDLSSELELTLEEAYHGGLKTLQFSSQTGNPAGVKSLDVKIPPLVRDGSKIRLKGQGGGSPAGGPAGDLLLTIRILPHSCFTLKGNNLEASARIYPEQAVLGCQVAVPTLDGEAKVTVPPMFHSGQKLRLRGKGWLDKDGKRGDELVKITIDIPRSIKPAEQEIYRKLAEIRKDSC